MTQLPDVTAGLWNSGLAWAIIGVLLGALLGWIAGNRHGEKRTLAHLRAWRVVEKLPMPPLTVRAPLHRDHPATGMACYHGEDPEGSAGE